ncbi:type IX secretion system PorP/SprF family membrane protein [Tenacibaculum adriaticum]|uniref:Type IX secretion system PorP/SprF family membrane protein n=1 Tax=Tenacibaculum adriaticum TaxID=413713 RepID=A0A5S5DQ23_9FLAO|nr:type IX secretion system membrane protein PorP/SprF [Tenacibaculum adriaticum]TYP97997.1 type IX secretion system PorP/SprF family membrane protein [Tenacibaculum adriaticum]
MKKIILLLIIFAGHLTALSQQDPQYTQYMYNQSIINPAYATTDSGIVNLGFMHRSQWSSAVGAPKTYNLFAHTPLSEKIEVGLSVITDNIGDGVLKENNIYADFAYVLKLNDTQKLSLGLKAGFTSFNTSFDDFRFPEDDPIRGIITNDEAFNTLNNTFPNFGVGAFYFTDTYYVGLSAPNFLQSKHLKEKQGLNSIGGEEIHFFLTGGYVYEINEIVKLKPAIMAKAVKGSPIVLDTSLNILFNNRFEGGLAYRIDDSVSAMFNVKATNTLRIGYAFDYTTSNLGNFNSGTHEIMVLFDLDLMGLKQGYDKSPRFF